MGCSNGKMVVKDKLLTKQKLYIGSNFSEEVLAGVKAKRKDRRAKGATKTGSHRIAVIMGNFVADALVHLKD